MLAARKGNGGIIFNFCYRSGMESLQKLSLPPQALERIKKLAGDLRLLCAKEVFKEAIEGNATTSHVRDSGPVIIQISQKETVNLTARLRGEN